MTDFYLSGLEADYTFLWIKKKNFFFSNFALKLQALHIYSSDLQSKQKLDGKKVVKYRRGASMLYEKHFQTLWSWGSYTVTSKGGHWIL